MTIDDAKAIPVNTDEFDAAVDLLSEACESGDKNAERVLAFMLQRNDDFLRGKVFAK